MPRAVNFQSGAEEDFCENVRRGSLVESWVQKLLVDGRQEQSWSEGSGRGVKREGSHFAMADSGA